MKKNKTSSFILELPLRTCPKEEKELLSRFESARHLYNATLGEAKKRVMLVRQSKLFQKARNLPKNNKQRKELFQLAKNKYNFSEYSLHQYVGKLRHNIVNNIDIHTAQKLATRAFRASEKILYGTAKKVRFKGYNQLNSVESKSNVAGIRWKNNQIQWNGLCLNPIIQIKNEVVCYGLQHKTKYCRILRKVIRGKNYFYVQLILEGKPLIKDKNKLGEGVVAFDFGPSTIAIVSQNKDNKFDARLLQFCSELKSKEKQIRHYQQKIDRQRRVSNPNNYLSNGKIKKGRLQWKKSKRQLENQKQLKDVYRITSSHRKSLQGKLINETLRMGNIFKTEKVSRKWLQSLYGKSVGMRAPGMYVSGMKRKAESAGGLFLEFPPQTTKLSQSCICERQHKKSLSERVHICECGVCVQRDLFSAYLALFVEKQGEKYVLQADQAKRYWSSADTLLQTAWRTAVQSTSGGTCPSSFGKPISQSQSGSFAKEGIAKFDVRNVVLAVKSKESPKENEVVSFKTYGIINPL